MSADNWTTCPQCVKQAAKNAENLYAKAAKLYGKVGHDEYTKAMEDAVQASGYRDRVQHSLREDYELGVDSDGKFSVSYWCSCKTCGFSWSYKVDGVDTKAAST